MANDQDQRTDNEQPYRAKPHLAPQTVLMKWNQEKKQQLEERHGIEQRDELPLERLRHAPTTLTHQRRP